MAFLDRLVTGGPSSSWEIAADGGGGTFTFEHRAARSSMAAPSRG
ncbi:MAG: hypothetical protein WBX25_15785 [Rhodomicrobium sp.]